MDRYVPFPSSLSRGRLPDLIYVKRLEQLEIAKQFYCQAVKLAPSNMRALYGLLLTTSQLAANPKCPQVTAGNL
jgi:hypothetical protein